MTNCVVSRVTSYLITVRPDNIVRRGEDAVLKADADAATARKHQLPMMLATWFVLAAATGGADLICVSLILRQDTEAAAYRFVTENIVNRYNRRHP